MVGKCDHGARKWPDSPAVTATTRRPRAARSTKIRPDSSADHDTGRLGSFPPPTPWSEQLAADNLRLAQAMASRMAANTRMPFDDLYLVALQGLLKGCRRYDPDRLNPATGRPYALSTCVVPFVRGAMAQWLRDKGHSSGVKFPDKWRDKAPVVRRLAADGGTRETVAAATGLPPEEVEAILAAQSATRLLDPDAQVYASCDPDPWDEAEGCEEFADALRIADEAHEALRWSDRALIEQAWDAPRRRQLARLPHGQFLNHARVILRGQKLTPAPEQQGLAIVVPDGNAQGPDAPRRRISEPAEILRHIEQLALFGPCHDADEGGKTAPAGIGGEGAAADQPSTRPRRAAVLCPSTPLRGDDRPGSGR